MFYDILTASRRPLLVVVASLGTLVMDPSCVRGQELKEFDADFLESPAAGPELAKAEKEIFRSTNEFRKQNGRSELTESKKLNRAAAYFAAYMARTEKYGHEADGNRPAERVELYDYDYCIAAENIAFRMNSAGFSTDELATGFFKGWKNSPPHRENLLDPDLTEIGIAIGYALILSATTPCKNLVVPSRNRLILKSLIKRRKRLITP